MIFFVVRFLMETFCVDFENEVDGSQSFIHDLTFTVLDNLNNCFFYSDGGFAGLSG